MQLDNKSYSYCYFALSEDNFVYASTTQVIFQNEKQLREGYSWSYNWENIQGVCISGHWVGVINKEEIKVFDIAGNQLHSICFDRKMVAIEAYENKLVVFYHCGVPVWGCQSLMMNVYCVTVSSSTFSHQCLLHLHPNSLLKWVGFSTEGMLFCQDTDEFVKSYNWETREWEVLLALDSQKEKLFIQHIENYNVYGFRVEQINGEHMEPTVMPRSLPRKIALDPPYIPIDFLLPEENVLISKLLLRIRILRHEQFRHDEWYQYKYSRGKDNINYAKSATIQTQ